MKRIVDSRDPSTFKYDNSWKHVLNQCATANVWFLLDSEGPRMAPAVSPYSIPAAVPLPLMPVVVNLPAISCAETLAPAQAREEIPIAKAKNTIDTKMDNMIKAIKALAFLLSKANDPRYGCYQTASAYTIQADHSPPHKVMNFTPLNVARGPTYYLPGHNYQLYSCEWLQFCIKCDKLEYILTLFPDVRTD